MVLTNKSNCNLESLNSSALVCLFYFLTTCLSTDRWSAAPPTAEAAVQYLGADSVAGRQPQPPGGRRGDGAAGAHRGKLPLLRGGLRPRVPHPTAVSQRAPSDRWARSDLDVRVNSQDPRWRVKNWIHMQSDFDHVGLWWIMSRLY